MNPFEDLQNPMDRLEELEIITTGHALCLENMSEQIKTHADLGIKISSSLIELVRHIDMLTSKVQELEYRLQQLE